MPEPSIKLVLSDVDGTLVTKEKVLTAEVVRAVERLNDAGIRFAVTSGRPPRGLAMLIDPLDLDTPMAGFNGGRIVDRDMNTIRELTIADEVVGPIIEVLQAYGLSIWIYQKADWFVLDLNGPRVEREAEVCQFAPSVIDSFDAIRAGVIKIVGVSDDPEVTAAAVAALNEAFSTNVSATRSAPYYVDVTHHDANKGSVVEFLAKHYAIETSEIATIGDMENDILMFEKSGLSIAVANANDDVKSSADHVTKSNDESGVAAAVESFILDPSR
jgi:hypothetical protein